MTISALTPPAVHTLATLKTQAENMWGAWGGRGGGGGGMPSMFAYPPKSPPCSPSEELLHTPHKRAFENGLPNHPRLRICTIYLLLPPRLSSSCPFPTAAKLLTNTITINDCLVPYQRAETCMVVGAHVWPLFTCHPSPALAISPVFSLAPLRQAPEENHASFYL